MAKKRKVRRSVAKAIAHVKATFNNTIITITDPAGEVLCWDSAGTVGFKGSRKSTPFAAQRAAENVADKAKKARRPRGGSEGEGPGSGRESAVTALQAAGIAVRSDRRRDAVAARRLPSAQEAARLMPISVRR